MYDENKLKTRSDMKHIIHLTFLIAGMLFPSLALAQTVQDSALIVTEIATDDTLSADSDTAKVGSWTFNAGGINANGTITCTDEEDLTDAEELFLDLFEDGAFFEKLSKLMDKYGWIFFIIPVLLIVVCPLLLLFIILFFVYRGRRAKQKEYEKRIASGQPIPHEVTEAMQDSDLKMRKEGTSNICVGVGLAIFLGVVMDMDLGYGIGALLVCIGIGKIIISGMDNKGSKK